MAVLAAITGVLPLTRHVCRMLLSMGWKLEVTTSATSTFERLDKMKVNCNGMYDLKVPLVMPASTRSSFIKERRHFNVFFCQHNNGSEELVEQTSNVSETDSREEMLGYDFSNS